MNHIPVGVLAGSLITTVMETRWGTMEANAASHQSEYVMLDDILMNSIDCVRVYVLNSSLTTTERGTRYHIRVPDVK